MSQQFGSDAVQNSNPTVVTANTETVGVLGNALTPPYNTCKAVLNGIIALTVGTGQTSVAIRIRRNPAAENVIVANYAVITSTPATTQIFPIMATDALPDGRTVQYEVTVQQAGGGGNGSIVFAMIESTLLSG